MEYFELGDLESHLKTPFSHTEARQIIQQLLEGLGFMHDNNFAHRDLKPTVCNYTYLSEFCTNWKYQERVSIAPKA
jgi:calcium/calmodulin-dependent protein kinase I